MKIISIEIISNHKKFIINFYRQYSRYISNLDLDIEGLNYVFGLFWTLPKLLKLPSENGRVQKHNLDTQNQAKKSRIAKNMTIK